MSFILLKHIPCRATNVKQSIDILCVLCDTILMIKVRNKLHALIKERSFIRGEITLASGQKSDHYFDMKKTMLHPKGAALICTIIMDHLRDAQVDCIGGLEMGAIPIISPLIMLRDLQGKPATGFFIRKKSKAHGTMRRVEGIDDIEGKHVLIVEDVTTTGNSALEAVEVIQTLGGNVAMVLTLLDRQQGAAALYKGLGIPFRPLFVASEFL